MPEQRDMNRMPFTMQRAKTFHHDHGSAAMSFTSSEKWKTSLRILNGSSFHPAGNYLPEIRQRKFVLIKYWALNIFTDL